VVYGIEETERRLIAKVLDPIRKQAESEINPLFANLALWAGYYYYLGGYKLNGPINPNPLPGKTLGSGRLEVAIDRMARFAGRNETEFKASSSNLIESLQQGLASRQGYPASKRYVERQIRSGFVFVRPRVRDPFREVTLTKEGRVVYADDGKPATVRKGTRIMVSESRRGGSQLAGANYHVYKTYNPILFKMALHDWGSREGRERSTASVRTVLWCGSSRKRPSPTVTPRTSMRLWPIRWVRFSVLRSRRFRAAIPASWLATRRVSSRLPSSPGT
jgi:hypothetical protein